MIGCVVDESGKGNGESAIERICGERNGEKYRTVRCSMNAIGVLIGWELIHGDEFLTCGT
ncbi:MAG: hypothetical protein Q4C47_01865 [Planctomycetia bacterium]|nr:hypothetical protein [Planctomycetia bacterium]